MLTEKQIEKLGKTQQFLRESLAPLIRQEIKAGLGIVTIEVTRQTLSEMMKDVSRQRGYFLEPELQLKIGLSICREIIKAYTAEMGALGKLIDEFRNAKPDPKVLAKPYDQLLTAVSIIETMFETIKNFESFE